MAFFKSHESAPQNSSFSPAFLCFDPVHKAHQKQLSGGGVGERGGKERENFRVMTTEHSG